MKNKETQNIKNNKKIEIFIFEFIRYALFKTEKKTEKSTKKKNNFFNLRKYLQIDFEHIAQTFMSLHGS